MPENIKILSIEVSNVTLTEAVSEVLALSEGNKASYVVTPNAEIAERANEEQELAQIINQAGLVVPDGIGVVLAAKLLGTPLKGKVAGVELAKALLVSLSGSGKKIVFFGGGEHVAEEARENILKQIPDLSIIAAINGYFTDQKEMIKTLAELQADVIFVCLGAPKQEYFMAEAAKTLSHGVMLGLGGTLDVFAGRVRRAPDFFVKSNLEWLYRIAKQPKRIGRAVKLPKYILSVLSYRLFSSK